MWDAFQHGARCAQGEAIVTKDDHPQHEDCLFLNVYAPGTKILEKKIKNQIDDEQVFKEDHKNDDFTTPALFHSAYTKQPISGQMKR